MTQRVKMSVSEYEWEILAIITVYEHMNDEEARHKFLQTSVSMTQQVWMCMSERLERY